MRRHWLTGALGLAGILALLAAACAPAAEAPKPATEAPKPATEAPKPATEAPKPVAEAPKPAAEAPKPVAEKPAAPKASVSGIPLEPDAKFGGTLRTGYAREGPSFSPWEEAAGVVWSNLSPKWNMLVRNQTWGTKADFDKQAYFELHPDLAKSWEQSADGLRWTFRLQDGVKWTDGQPFACADAKWSLDTIRTGAGLLRSPRALQLIAVKEIQCADALTMVIRLSRPKPGLLGAVGNPHNPILPKHVYDGKTELMRKDPFGPGTGPFIVKEWVAGERYAVQRNNDYWNKPFPYLDGIDYAMLSPTAQATGLRAGRLHTGALTGFAGGPAETLIRECALCQVWPKVTSQGPYVAVMLNHQRPPWSTPEVKDAISLAIDRQMIAKLAQGGWGRLATGGPFHPDSYWAMPKERLAAIPGYDFAADPAESKRKAREILARAGFRPQELKVTINIWNNPGTADAAPLLIEDLKAVGIEAKASLLETARAYAAWSAGEFDVGVHSFWDGGIDPDYPLYEQFYTGSDRNYNRYSNPEYDRLVDLQSITIDPAERRRIAWNAAEIALREHAKIYTIFGEQTNVWSKLVRGMIPGPGHLTGRNPWYRYETVWLAEK